jgi:hypothetical protein
VRSLLPGGEDSLFPEGRFSLLLKGTGSVCFYPLPIYHTLLLFTSIFFFVPEIDQATEVYSKDGVRSLLPGGEDSLFPEGRFSLLLKGTGSVWPPKAS